MKHKKILSLSLLTVSLLCSAPASDSRTAASGVVTTREQNLVRQAEAKTGDRFTVATRTAGGVRVFAHTKPAPQMLQAIDAGFADLLTVARRNGYRARLRMSDYTVFIARPDRTNDPKGAYSPALKIPAQGYSGSVFDRGGYVFAAGMVLTFEPCSFVVPDHTRDWARVTEVVRYEGEHIVLYHNDRRRYEATVDHSRGGAHPILR